MINWLYSSYNVEKEREMYNFWVYFNNSSSGIWLRERKKNLKNNGNNLYEVKDEVEVEMEGERGGSETDQGK